MPERDENPRRYSAPYMSQIDWLSLFASVSVHIEQFMRSNSTYVVMLSGASRGIGAEIGKRLLAEGYVLSLGLRDPYKQGWWSDATPQDRILVSPYEASDPDAAKNWVKSTTTAFGRIDALINNAGIMRSVRLEDEEERELQELWNINVIAPLRVIRSALPYLKATGKGRVINIVSLAGKRVRGNQVGYAMSKHAMMALTHTIRKSCWDSGVRATAICPGIVSTDMTADMAGVSQKEMIQPEDIATVIDTILKLPNSSSIAEVLINCRFEDTM
jgi:NADP-dependent 3-hydroxy acid dehydrogenase YdfG